MQFDVYINDLYILLQKICRLDNHCTTGRFSESINNLLTDTHNYLHKDQSPTIQDVSSLQTVTVAHSPTTVIPPFTPLALPDFSKLNQTPCKQKQVQFSNNNSRTPKRKHSPKATPKNSGSIKYATPKTTSSNRKDVSGCTPRFSDEDLRKSLLKSKENLRHTPGLIRSPGGTPKSKRPCLDLRDPTDLVTYALRKKFQSVRKLYGSPSTESPDTSVNISID